MNAISPIPPGDNALAAMAADLADKGWARADGWFGAELCAALREDALARFMAEEDAPAGVGREGDFTLDRSVRQCRLAWLDGGDPAQSAFLARAEALRLELNRRLYLGLLEFEACYAFYPEGGYYGRHRDSFRGARNRVVSLVLYLNPEWDTDWGGQLIVYEGETPVPVDPAFASAVLMLSEETEHEVAETRHPRLAVAAWWRVNQTVVRETPLAAI